MRKPSFCLIIVLFVAQNHAKGKLFGESLGLICNFAELFSPFTSPLAAMLYLRRGPARVLSCPLPRGTAGFGRKRGGMEKCSAIHPERGQPDSTALLN